MSCTFKSRKYDYNVTLVKSYGNSDLMRVVTMGAIRRSGIVDDNERPPPCKNDVKLDASLSRARKMIFEYVLCNDFEYFFTLTINRFLHSADNLDSLHKKISAFFKKINRSYNCSIKYVLVPELHSDGTNYHFHGVIKNIPSDLLYEFRIGDAAQKFGYGILNRLKRGYRVFHFVPFTVHFGFNSLSPIRDSNKTASYLTKYITKNVGDNHIPVGSHLYYCSRGLNSAKVVLKGHLIDYDLPVHFSNDYCSISNLSLSNDFDKIKEIII